MRKFLNKIFEAVAIITTIIGFITMMATGDKILLGLINTIALLLWVTAYYLKEGK